MNIRQEIAKEHSLDQAKKISGYACSSKERFKELMNCFIASEYRIAQRAAWAVSLAATKNPSYILPYIKLLVTQLNRTDVHNAVVRNSLRILQEVSIPEELHGEVMNACFTFIEKTEVPAAIKAFSLTVLENLSEHYPEIRQELKLVIEERWNVESPAFKSRAKKFLLK